MWTGLIHLSRNTILLHYSIPTFGTMMCWQGTQAMVGSIGLKDESGNRTWFYICWISSIILFICHPSLDFFFLHTFLANFPPDSPDFPLARVFLCGHQNERFIAGWYLCVVTQLLIFMMCVVVTGLHVSPGMAMWVVFISLAYTSDALPLTTSFYYMAEGHCQNR